MRVLSEENARLLSLHAASGAPANNASENAENAASAAADARVAELQAALDARAQSEDFLVQEIAALSRALDEGQAETARVKLLLREKEDSVYRNLAVAAGKDRQLALADKAQQLLQAKLDALASEAAAKELALRRAAEYEAAHRHTVAVLERRCLDRDFAYDRERRTRELAELARSTLHGQVEDYRARDVDSEARVAEQAALVEASLAGGRRAEEERDAARRELVQLRKQFKSGDRSHDALKDAEIAELRRQLNCGACMTRRRDTIILKCMHIFCNDCVRSVIDNRSRKCPQCGLAFSQTEYKRIYLS